MYSNRNADPKENTLLKRSGGRGSMGGYETSYDRPLPGDYRENGVNR